MRYLPPSKFILFGVLQLCLFFVFVFSVKTSSLSDIVLFPGSRFFVLSGLDKVFPNYWLLGYISISYILWSLTLFVICWAVVKLFGKR